MGGPGFEELESELGGYGYVAGGNAAGLFRWVGGGGGEEGAGALWAGLGCCVGSCASVNGELSGLVGVASGHTCSEELLCC